MGGDCFQCVEPAKYFRNESFKLYEGSLDGILDVIPSLKGLSNIWTGCPGKLLSCYS